jgi:hypothetical protein
MDCIVHGVAKSQTRLSDFHMEEDMATHSSILASRVPQTGAPVGYSPWGRTESDSTGGLSSSTSTSIT